eukprot:893699-Amorphochlora_amoeboformis.AAC.1
MKKLVHASPIPFDSQRERRDTKDGSVRREGMEIEREREEKTKNEVGESISVCMRNAEETEIQCLSSKARKKGIRVSNECIADGWLERHPGLIREYFPILCNWLVELHFELFKVMNHPRRLRCQSPLNPVHLATIIVYNFLE